MDVSVVLRTCDRVSCFSGGDRLLPVSKQEVILRSLQSLLKSMNVAIINADLDTGELHDMELVIIDDNSSDETLVLMQDLCNYWGIQPKMFQVEGTGNGDSLKSNYEWGRDHGKELIYYVEDDYLHDPEMMAESLSFYHKSSKRPGMERLVVHPCDYPDRYYRDLYKSWILPGKAVHWRTIQHTTCSFLVPKSVLVDYWDHYMGFTKYGKDPGVTEDTTFNKVYRDIKCWSPMPSLSIHLQYDATISPLVNWHDWWEANKVNREELECSAQTKSGTTTS